jgi:hypothetical protein
MNSKLQQCVSPSHEHEYLDTILVEAWCRDSDASGSWFIANVERVIGLLANEPGYWIVPTDNDLDKTVPKIGPFETLEVAAVAAALME